MRNPHCSLIYEIINSNHAKHWLVRLIWFHATTFFSNHPNFPNRQTYAMALSISAGHSQNNLIRPTSHRRSETQLVSISSSSTGRLRKTSKLKENMTIHSHQKSKHTSQWVRERAEAINLGVNCCHPPSSERGSLRPIPQSKTLCRVWWRYIYTQFSGSNRFRKLLNLLRALTLVGGAEKTHTFVRTLLVYMLVQRDVLGSTIQNQSSRVEKVEVKEVWRTPRPSR